MPVIGAMYRLTVRGRALPNLYRFEREEAEHCQLHGDYTGQRWLFRKRRNSDKRPWGSALHSYSADNPDLRIERVTE